MANKQKSRRQKPVSDGQAAALLWASATSPSSSLCMCVFVCVGAPLGAEQHLLLVVKCKAVEWLGTGRGCRDVQPLVALLCDGGLSVCSPDRLSQPWLRPPFVTADSGWVCFPLCPPSPFSSLCFSIDSEIEGSEVMRGWTMERGAYLGNGDLFVCTRAKYPSPFFYSPPIAFPLLHHSASCSFPSGDPSPGLMAPGQ